LRGGPSSGLSANRIRHLLRFKFGDFVRLALDYRDGTLSLPKTVFKLTRGLRRNQNIIAA
jgi:hypothetical protein